MLANSQLERTGVVVRKHSAAGVDSVAVYDTTEVYRFYLQRTWDVAGSQVAFIGLNPSTATEFQNDPTVNRCQNFARDWGHGGFVMLNAFGLRSTDPRGLRLIDDPVGEFNDEFILLGVQFAQQVVCCWGTHAKLQERHQQLKTLLSQQTLFCFRETQAGYPNHPLYLKSSSVPVRYWS